MSELILKTLVGSRAHGIASEGADYDYRGVYITPTSELLSLFSTNKKTQWIEGGDDNTSWEISHFCFLATKCNPTILEALVAPVISMTDEGEQLRRLFPCFLDSKAIYCAFSGYSHNQMKKMMDGAISAKGSHWTKFAAAYIRVLWQGIKLLQTGNLPVELDDDMKKKIMAIKKWECDRGDAIKLADYYRCQFERMADITEDKFTQDIDKINKFILDIRRKHW